MEGAAKEPLEKEELSAQPRSTTPSSLHPSSTGPHEVDEVNNALQATATTASAEEDYVTGWKLAAVLIIIVLACFLALLDTTIVATAIPRITSEFHSLQDVGWYGSAYLITNCSIQPVSGKLYTYFGPKWVFLGFFFVFELGSLLCGLANSSKMFIVGRAVAGLGCSGLLNGAFTIVAASVPLTKRPPIFGVLIACSQLALVVGPLIGGLLTQYSTWRWCFYINLPCGGVVMGLFFLIEIPSRGMQMVGESFWNKIKKLDLIGFLIFAPFAAQFLLAIQWGGVNYRWGSATIIGLFCGSFGTLCVFTVWNYYGGDDAMLPVSIMRRRVVAFALLTQFFMFGSQLITTYYMPIYFQSVKGASPSMSGVDVLPTILSQILSGIPAGFAVTKLHYYTPFLIAGSMISCIGSGLLTTLKYNTGIGKWIGYQIVAGFGRGLGMQMTIIAVQNVLPADQNSLGMSMLIFMQFFGGAVFLSFAELDFSQGLNKGLARYAPLANATAIIGAGATGFRAVVPEDQVIGVLKAYALAIDNVFYLVVGCTAACFLVSWGVGFGKLRKAAPKDQKEEKEMEKRGEKGTTDVERTEKNIVLEEGI